MVEDDGWVANMLVGFFSELEASPDAHLLVLAMRQRGSRGFRDDQLPLQVR